MNKAAIEITHVEQRFTSGFWMQPKRVLQDVSFQVPKGGVFGLLGSNGAGKTSLIHLIAGLRRPTLGSVQIFGAPAQVPSARQKLGYLPERPYFYEHLTGEQFLMLQGTLSDMKRSQLTNRIQKTLESVRLGHARHQTLRTYSKGMLQRIGIAQAVIHDPDLIVLDEPMSGLDPQGRAEIRQLLLELSRKGHTVFFSSHLLQDMEAMCDRIALLHQGRLIQTGPLSTLLKDEKVIFEVTWSEGVGEGFEAKGVRIVTPPQRTGDLWSMQIEPTKGDQNGINGALRALMERGAEIRTVQLKRRSLEAWVQELTS